MKGEFPTPPEGYEWRYRKQWLTGVMWIELLRKDRRINKTVGRFSVDALDSLNFVVKEAQETVIRALMRDKLPGLLRRAVDEANSQEKENRNG